MLQRNLICYCILLLAIAALLIPVVWIEYNVLQHTNGILTYPTDNAFSDMAVAQNLAFHQVWGMSKHSFGPAGSSLLYIVLLAIIFFVTGAHTFIPLAVNAVAVVWFLVAFQRWLISQGVRPGYQLLIMLLVIYGIPLPLLVVGGMGYTLQLLFGFLFAVSLRQLSSGRVSRKVYIYALLMVAANVEMIILLAIACGLLIGQRRWKLSFKMGGIAVFPMILFGAIALSKGTLFIPHVVSSRPGAPPRINCANVRQACIDTYNEPYQMARFVHRYFNKWHIACNAIGAVSYYSEGNKLDLGISRSANLVDSLIRRDYIHVAILYDKRLNTNNLFNWNKIASWQIPGQLTTKEDSVSFYAFAKDSLLNAHLRQNLQEYQPRLPAEVTVRYY
jgi:hypothetical protein